jgi:hypothetical protein
MKTTILLGAGASAAEGAPLQASLFREYFKSIRDQIIQDEMDIELATYFELIFGIDCNSRNLDAIQFPTFEEALGIVDLAMLRNESLKDFHNINPASNSGRIGFIRQHLVLLLARVIDSKLQKSKDIHKRLVQNLKNNNLLSRTSFVSTNYDILIDNALVELYPDVSLDYGIEFTNFKQPGDWSRPSENAIQLLKIHGSLNWLFCPTCNTVTLTPKEKGVIRLFKNIECSFCQPCETIYSPIIVPPTFYKDMSNVYLQVVWNKSEQILRESENIIFCGYSFPDADMHIKYLLKRVQTNRNIPCKFTVINNHEGKQQSLIDVEKDRFARFLGQVDYTELSFEDFADNPSSLIK